MCLDFESMVALHLCMFPKKREKLWTIDLKNASLLDVDLELFTGSWPRKQKLIIARDVKFDESLLGLGNFRNKVEPLYIDDDEEERKDAQAPIEDVKEPTSEKPAFKIAKEVQLVLRRSLRLKAKEDAKKKEGEMKDSKEDDPILTDIETCSDSEPPEESDESSQGILNSIVGLFSRFSEAAAKESKEWIEAIQSEVSSR